MSDIKYKKLLLEALEKIDEVTQPTDDLSYVRRGHIYEICQKPNR